MKKLLFFISLIAVIACFTPTASTAQAWSIKINNDQDRDSVHIMLSDTVYSKYRHGKFKSYNAFEEFAMRTMDGSEKYLAVLTQATTAAPTAAIKRNTLAAGVPVITRDSIGTYKLTKTAAFATAAKTTVQATINTGTASIIKSYWQSDSTIIVRCESTPGIGADLTGTCTLEICIWPN